MKHLILFLLGVAASPGYAQLSGNYTIDPNGSGPGSFKSFGEAVDSLITYGVSGPVVFNAANGTYNEQIIIPSISGASAQNTITFQGSSGDSTDVVLDYPSYTSGGYNCAIELNGADYLTFRKMSIIRSGSERYARVLYIRGGSEHNTFSNNYMSGNTVGSSADNALVYSPQDNDNHNAFVSNHFSAGGTLFLYYGNSSGETGTIIKNNFADSCEAGIYLKYQHGPQVLHNYLDISASNNYHSGIEIRNCDNAPRIYGNTVISDRSRVFGLSIQDSDCDSNQRGEISNNSFNTYSGNYALGVYIYNSSNHDLFHNSVQAKTNSSSAIVRALTISNNSAGIALWNNIFYTSGDGYAMWSDAGSIRKSINNNFYSHGDSVVSYGQTYASIADWQMAAAPDSGSLSFDPLFRYPLLKPSEIALNNAARPIASIQEDLSGQQRNPSAPDIGAYEFEPYVTDVRLTGFASPIDACRDTSEVRLSIRNNGSQTIDSVSIQLTLNQVQLYDTVLILHLPSASDTILHFADIPITQNSNTLQVTLYDASGNADADSSDNMLTSGLVSRMSGHYSIGGSSPDYSGLADCYYDLRTRGVCGPVFLNLADGDYLTSIRLEPVPGASIVNTITFQSAARDSSRVRLHYPSSGVGGTNYIIWLAGADYFHFRDLSFERTGTNFYTRIILLTNDAEYNRFSNNSFRGNTSAGSSSSLISDISDDSRNGFNTFDYNYFTRMTYGIYFNGRTPSPGLTIIGNRFDTISEYAIHLVKRDQLLIRDNLIMSGNLYADGGISLDSCHSFEISGNRILPDRGSQVLRLRYCYAGTSGAKVFNNLIRFGGVINSKGIDLYGCSGIGIYFNTVILERFHYTNNTCLYLDPVNGTQNRLQSNILANYTGGLVIDDQAGTLGISDHNALYTQGSVFGNYGTAVTNLEAWRALSGLDLSSIEKNPLFHPDSKPRSGFLNNRATVISGIDTDINGNARSQSPDPGVLEFSVDSFAVILDIWPTRFCEDSAGHIAVVLGNLGSVAQSGILLQGNVSGMENGTFQFVWPNTLDSMQSDTLFLPDSIYSLGYDSLNVDLVAVGTISGSENDSFSVRIDVDPSPIVSFGFSDGCTGIPVPFTSSASIRSPGSISNYHWSFGNGDTAMGMNVSGTFSSADSFEIRHTVVSDKGCETQAVDWIHIHPVPDATFGYTVGSGRTVQFQVQENRLPAATYSWDFGDGNTDTGYSVSHSYTSDGTYSIQLEVLEQSCSGNSSQTLNLNTSGFAGIKPGMGLKVYPVPFESLLKVEYTVQRAGEVYISLYDLSGKQVVALMHHVPEAGLQQRSLELPVNAGTYYLEIRSGEQISRQLVIKK